MVDAIRREWVYLWYYFTLQLGQIFPYWVMGMVLGPAISVFAKEHIHGLFRSLGNKKLGMLGVIPASILGIASPLCMYGTIPLAAAFMITGPATKITNLGAVKIVLGVKRFILYLLFIILYALLTGWIIDLIL